jgi:hypothetical protein
MNATVTTPLAGSAGVSALSDSMGPSGQRGKAPTPHLLGRKPSAVQSKRIFPERTPKTAADRAECFKLGFLAKVAELGLTPNEFFSFTKNAILDIDKLMDKTVGGTLDLGSSALSKGLELGGSALGTAGNLALWGPLAIGGAHGALREYLETPPAQNIDVLRKMETLGLYRRLTNEIRNRMAMRGA